MKIFFPAFVRRAIIRTLSVSLLLMLLAGCRFSTSPVVPNTGPNPPGKEPVAPQVIEQRNSAALEPVISDEAPLRFTLPTPGPMPISLWRPPLYDTPWALGPEDHFYFSRPIAADKVNWPVADYRYGGVFFSPDTVHTGVDIPTPTGTPVLAAASGKVIWAGYGLFYGNNDPDDPYGLAVTIRHNFGFKGERLYTVYAHMDEVKVVNGQEVKAGDLIGLVGTTGFTTGPHLHFEVRTDRNSYFATLNPELWLAPPQGWGVLVGQVLNSNRSLLPQQDVNVRNLETKQKWVVRSYGDEAVNSDPYYQENLVLSDLPAGRYELSIEYQEEEYTQEIEIHPGAVSYFTFRGKLSFDTSLPPTPSIDELLGEDTP